MLSFNDWVLLMNLCELFQETHTLLRTNHVSRRGNYAAI